MTRMHADKAIMGGRLAIMLGVLLNGAQPFLVLADEEPTPASLEDDLSQAVERRLKTSQAEAP
jgi:hypothetical protein